MSTSKCLNASYDVLTILISIADVATDVIVLIDWYNKDRMIFFFLSLSILILAQCAYSIAFALKFETEPSWGAVKACCCFLCLLPFGTFVAFCFYMNEQDVLGFRDCVSSFHLRNGNAFSTSNSSYSRAMVWIRNKLNRHLGFLLEAVIEAFPQSMLQIVAIVYYQEANYISIISILLSMFSVMTKSLILSQGIDKWTFIWTWLCAVTDFFGIFFILTWAFYSNEYIYGNYYGLFNIFGFVWFWKFVISVASIAATGVILFALFGYWVFIGLFMYHEGPLLACIWCCLGPVMCVLTAFAACLGFEVMCFSFLAFGIFKFSTSKIASWSTESTSVCVQWMLNFVKKSRHKPLGILAIARGMKQSALSGKQVWCRDYPRVDKLITQCEKDNGKLIALTYKEIRSVDYPKENILGKMCALAKKKYDKAVWGFHTSFTEFFFETSAFLIYSSLMFLFGPLLVIGKIMQISLPYCILGYLVYFDLLIGGKVDTFQLVMLFIYIGLQLIVFVIGIKVFKIHWYLYHVGILAPSGYWNGVGAAGWNNQYEEKERCNRHANEWYDSICWYPEVEKMILRIYGDDIGLIILDYFVITMGKCISNFPQETKPKPKLTNFTMEQMKDAMRDAVGLESLENGIIDAIVDYVCGGDITEIFNFKDEKDTVVLSGWHHGPVHSVQIIFIFKPYNQCDLMLKNYGGTFGTYNKTFRMEYKNSFDEIGIATDDSELMFAMVAINARMCGLRICSFPVSMFEDMLNSEDCNGTGKWLQCKKGNENEGILWTVEKCPAASCKGMTGIGF